MSEAGKVAIVPVRKAYILRVWSGVAMLAAAAVAVWVFAYFQTASMAGDKESSYSTVAAGRLLEVTFLGVGQGDSMFIKTPGGKCFLIDAGPGEGEYSNFDAGKRVVVPFLQSRGISRIDAMMMTHPHADHYGGMDAVLDSIEVGEFIDPGMEFTSFAYEDLLKKVRQKEIPIRFLREPEILDWDSSILVQTLWPETNPRKPGDPNNNSIVTRIAYGQVVYMLTGDIEAVVEQELFGYGSQLRTTILKIPHHGSDTSSSRRLLELMMPRLGIFTVGLNNKFGHPDKSTIDRYTEFGIQTLRTDQNGTIQTLTDGETVRVKPQRGAQFTLYPYPSVPPQNL